MCIRECVHVCLCVIPCWCTLLGLRLPLICCVGPSHHFEVTAKWPVAQGSGQLGKCLCVFVCVFALRRLIDTKWYQAGAHQRWPSQLTETVIYSFTEQYLHGTPAATSTHKKISRKHSLAPNRPFRLFAPSPKKPQISKSLEDSVIRRSLMYGREWPALQGWKEGNGGQTCEKTHHFSNLNSIAALHRSVFRNRESSRGCRV